MQVTLQSRSRFRTALHPNAAIRPGVRNKMGHVRPLRQIRSILLLTTIKVIGPDISAGLPRSHAGSEHITIPLRGCSVHALWTFLSVPLARSRQARLLIAPQGCCLLRPSRPGFRLTLWCQQVTRVSQQFSEFSSARCRTAAPLNRKAVAIGGIDYWPGDTAFCYRSRPAKM